MLAWFKKVLAAPLAAGSKFDVGHLVLFLTFFATTGGPTLYTFLTSEGLSVPAQYVTKGIATAAFIVAVYKQWAGQSQAAVDDAKKASTPPPAAGGGAASSATKIASAIVLVLGMGAGSVALVGCPGGPVSPNTVQTVLTDEGYACAVVQLVDNIIVGPTTGTVEQVASAIQAACSAYIPQAMTNLVVNLVNAFAAQVPPDAGVTMPALSAWLKAHPPSVHR